MPDEVPPKLAIKRLGSLSGGTANGRSETVGERSKATPRSPRTYQFVPSSNMVGDWLPGMLIGGAVPKRSAAEAGAVSAASPAQARENGSFIGHPRIAAPARDSATL